jgi:hypothetical protein
MTPEIAAGPPFGRPVTGMAIQDDGWSGGRSSGGTNSTAKSTGHLRAAGINVCANQNAISRDLPSSSSSSSLSR